MPFPNLLRRYLATLIDMIVVIALVGFIGLLPLGEPQKISVLVLLVLVVLAYDALLTVFACTLGQWLMRLRVRRVDGHQRIGFAQAFLRTLMKYCLGIVSFLSMPVQKEKRALHDLATGTLVLNVGQVH